jgi:hypothetical protein
VSGQPDHPFAGPWTCQIAPVTVAIVTGLPCDSQAQISIGPHTTNMTNQSKLSSEDDQAPPAERLENDVDESSGALQRSDAASSGRTYTVTGLVQAHVHQRSLGSYVKGG